MSTEIVVDGSANMAGPGGLANAQDLPPSYVDFASGHWDLHPPFAPTKRRYIFSDCLWLGGTHDGYPLVPIEQYRTVRWAHHEEVACPTAREVAALEQSYLTFGLLEATMCIKIPERFLLSRSAAGEMRFSLDNLSVLLRDWRYRIRRHGLGEQCRSWTERVYSALFAVNSSLTSELVHPGRSEFRRAGLSGQVISGILCTAAAMAQALLSVPNIFPLQYRPLPPAPFLFNLLSTTSSIRAQMTTNGWCPFTVSIIDSYGLSAMGYASTLPPFVRGSADEHRQCTQRECGANNVDVARYRAQHAHALCTCSHISVPIQDVQTLLDSGVVPVIVPDGASLSVRAASNVPYVAISHVWVDGLGSDTERGLPLCQIQRIAPLVRALVPSGAFWMDSLCIPAERRTRRLAIGLMARTYGEAAAVLVLDAGIRVCRSNATIEEKALRVLTSGWAQRLWTLQEAMLARDLNFEFSDGLTRIEELIPATEDIMDDPLMASLGMELHRLTTYRERSGVRPRPFSLAQVSRTLKWRSTSKYEDETLAISSLVGVDAAELAGLPSHDERMKALLVGIGSVDPGIITFPGDRLEIPGFSWAPRTLMVHGSANLSIQRSGERPALCTPDGLLGEYALVQFAPTTFEEGTSYALQDARSQRTYSWDAIPVKGLSTQAHRCSAVLLSQGNLPGKSEAALGASVFVEGGVEEGPGGDRLVCKFGRRLWLREVSSDGTQDSGYTIISAKSSRARVRLV